MKPRFLHASATLALSLGLAALPPTAHAGSATIDFNDNTAGPLGAFNAGEGQTGGTGFDEFETWGNTGTIGVVAGDLTAPAATGYSATQSGTPQSIQGTFSGGRQTTRALAEPLTGTVWFSFLVNQPTANSRGGITFNQNTSGPGDPRIVFTGADLRLGLSSIQPPGGGANDLITLAEDHLVLGRLTIDPLGDDVLDLWVDPDVTGGEAALPPSDNFTVQDVVSFDFGIDRVGLQSYSSDGQGGIVDHFRISDAANAFAFVTSSADVVADDPDLGITSPLPLFGTLPDQVLDVTRTLTVTNRGTTNDLVISDAEPTGFDAALFSVLTPLPVTVPPGGSAGIDVRFNASAEPDPVPFDFDASLTISSNDASTPDTVVPLPTTRFDSTANLVLNGDLEEDFFPDFWTASFEVIEVPGLIDGSTKAAWLSLNGQTLDQATPQAGAHWYVDFYFAVQDSTNRQLSVFVPTGPTLSSAAINLRYQSGAFNTFAAGSWGGDLGLGTVEPSVDADANGSLDDPGDTKNVYRMRITGTGWGTGDSSYDIQLSEANSDDFTRSAAGISRYQAGSGDTGTPSGIHFTSVHGNNPGFWVDDVTFKNLPAPDDPNLAVSSPLPLFGTLPVDSPGETRTLTLSNSGAAQDLVVTGANLSGPDADHYTVLTDPLPTIAPGATGDIEIRFDAKGETGNFAATLTVVSNDTSTPESPLALPSAVFNTGTVVSVNGSFDEPGFTDPGWGTAGPNLDFGLPVASAAPGLSPTSTTSAFVEGFGSVLGQAVTGTPDWHLEFLVAITEADFRGFQMYVHNLGNATRSADPGINLRHELGGLAVYDKAGPAWVELTEIPGLTPSTDADNNGSLGDPGDTAVVYRIRITGRDWGTPEATYAIAVSAPGTPGTLVAETADLAFWGGGLGDGRNSVPTSFVFHTLAGDNPGFFIDDVSFAAGLPTETIVPVEPAADLRITEVTYDPLLGEASITWNADPGKTYTVETSADLTTWTVLDSGLPGPTYSDTLATGTAYVRVRED